MDKDTEDRLRLILQEWQGRSHEYFNLQTRQAEVQERIATSHELLAERVKMGSWLAALVLGLLLSVTFALMLQALGFVTLFEDGSVQFFNQAGWGFCLFPQGGCS